VVLGSPEKLALLIMIWVDMDQNWATKKNMMMFE
jgi:hypothetical protein